MKQKINQWIYRNAIRVIAKRIVFSKTPLTKEYLIARGWTYQYEPATQKRYYFELGIKNRDRIFIEFEAGYYRVWHSEQRVFIALENSLEWFEIYYLLAHGDNGRFKLAGI